MSLCKAQYTQDPVPFFKHMINGPCPHFSAEGIA